jgi:dTDP-4-dehydrorhamnose reductase
MRILLTGVTGQVGRALIAPLNTIGTVLAAKREELDLSDPESISEVLSRLAPDLIVNPAAYTAVDRAEDEPELAFRVNAEAPGIIAKWAAARGVPLIHFSTDYVFDGLGERPRREDSPTGPLSVYGVSKFAGETAIRAVNGPHLIVRTSWVYAAKGTNFFRTIARLAKERKQMKIVADQIGAPTSAKVIANAVAEILKSDLPGLIGRFAKTDGVVNIAASGETSWHGFATAIVDGLKSRGVKLEVESIVPIRTEDFPTKAMRPGNSRFDLARLRDVFGIVTPSWNGALAVELDELAKELI